MKCLAILLCSLAAWAADGPRHGGELRFSLRADPKTFDPHLVGDEHSYTVQYLTGGVLTRFNRRTQSVEPELASSWKVDLGGRRITLKLRKGVQFSDGTPFTAADVAYTFRRMMDPALHSPIGDMFRSGAGKVQTVVSKDDVVAITFPAPVGGLERLLDQVSIVSEKAPLHDKAVLGPFVLKEHKAGAHLLFVRNPRYWKRDSKGLPLPYLDAVRITIQQNRETELLRFRRGEIELINSVDAKLFDRLAAEMPGSAADLGPSLDSEFLWFNQSAAAPIPAHRKAWFQSASFRKAISAAIRRNDLVRLAFNGHAVPAAGPVSPANHVWMNRELKPQAFDPAAARRLLEKDGFRRAGANLQDAAGNAVQFSLITSAGNPARARMASLIQQDLAELGIRIQIVTLDFPSLVERISRTADYEACLLGFVNVDFDPNGQMNVFLSSASNHPWNPRQAKPATAWEAEMDILMTEQAGLADTRQRKAKFDRVQRILWEQAPIIYLVHKNHLVAVSQKLAGADPRPISPQTFWNIEWISLPQPRVLSSR